MGIILAQANQSGTVLTNWDNWPVDATTVTATCILSDTDLADSSITFAFQVHISDDGGTSYTQAGYTWQGGTTPPLIALAPGLPTGSRTCRVQLDLSQSINIGVEVAYV